MDIVDMLQNLVKIGHFWKYLYDLKNYSAKVEKKMPKIQPYFTLQSSKRCERIILARFAHLGHNFLNIHLLILGASSR